MALSIKHLQRRMIAWLAISKEAVVSYYGIIRTLQATEENKAKTYLGSYGPDTASKPGLMHEPN
jgi:hypothetical protein